MRRAILAAVVAVPLACGPAVLAPVSEAAYLAQQLRCVDESTTRVQADACRARIKATWAYDAGADR